MPTTTFMCEETPVCCSEKYDIKELTTNKCLSLKHPLYEVIPRHRCQVNWYDVPHWTTWALFGNDDDGIFGEEPTAHYHLDKPPSIPKALAWAWRNPLHNFCFYVIGSAYTRNSEFTILELTPTRFKTLWYSPQGTTIFAGKGTGFFLGLHGWKPFVSLRWDWNRCHTSKFYFGWRCQGNFGIKCVLWGRRKT